MPKNKTEDGVWNTEPEYIVKVHDSASGMRGILVVDNTVLGPGKGGIRMTPGVNEEEVRRLARAMTYKNALAGIPFGGAKAGMIWPGGTERQKKEHVQSFARALRPFIPGKYIAGPDVNSGEKEMQWFAEALNNWRAATGKPAVYCVKKNGRQMCGLPHELGSTGFGVAQAAAVAVQFVGVSLRGAKVAIHGFGNVGTFAFKFLTEMEAKIVAIADSRTTLYDAAGLNPQKIQKLIAAGKKLDQHPDYEKLRAADFWSIPTDVLIPASVTDVINDGNKNKIKTKLIVEAGNIPMRENVEDEFFRKGVMIVPDFVANAGGVISSYAEHAGYAPEKMFKLVKDKISRSTQAVLTASVKNNINPRGEAMKIATQIISQKGKSRRTAFT